MEGLIVLYIASVLRGRTLLGDVERAHQRMRRDRQGLIDEFAPYARQLAEQGVADVLVPVSVVCGCGGGCCCAWHASRIRRRPFSPIVPPTMHHP